MHVCAVGGLIFRGDGGREGGVHRVHVCAAGGCRQNFGVMVAVKVVQSSSTSALVH
jgi:hypothetical protein